MRKLLGWRLGFLVLALLGSSGLAQAYTRAYLTNNTGQTVYQLHVVLLNPAKPNPLGSGDPYSPTFGLQTVSPDGMTLTFSDPLSPLGIEAGETVHIGWVDLDPGLSADIAYYYWTDDKGNRVGAVQYMPPAGSDPDLGGSGPGGGSQPPGGGQPSGPSVATPEPGAWVLMLVGLACLAIRFPGKRSLKSVV